MRQFKLSPRIRIRERICWVAELVRNRIKIFAASRGWTFFQPTKADGSRREFWHAKDALQHCLTMIDPIIRLARYGHMRKAVEKLQFVKGVLWTLGVCSEDQMVEEWSIPETSA